MVTISQFTHEIDKAGLTFQITSDSRGNIPGNPVQISINRRDRPFTSITLRTLNPIDREIEDTDNYFITHAIVDDAATLRVRQNLSPNDLWRHVYSIRTNAINAPSAFFDHPAAQPRPFRQRSRRPYRSNHSNQERYLQPTSKHFRSTVGR